MATIKVGEFWKQNSLGLLDCEAIDKGFIFSVNNNYVYFGTRNGNRSLLRRGQFLRYYKKEREQVIQSITCVNIDGFFYVPMAINNEEWVEVVDANASGN